jgi:purine nucleosidase
MDQNSVANNQITRLGKRQRSATKDRDSTMRLSSKPRGTDRMRSRICVAAILVMIFGFFSVRVQAAQQSPAPAKDPEKIIIDTDIGDDIDDAFAVALALQSPEVRILGFSTVTGDTTARAKILDEMLGQSDHRDIPVAAGKPANLPFTTTPYIGRQGRFGEMGRFAKATHPPAVEFILEQINRFPGQITLVAIGPLSNIGSLIDKDPQAFRRLKRVVMMGGSIAAGYDDAIKIAVPEYNILADIPSAQKLFQSGVPIYMMPLDSTAQLKFDEVKRAALFYQASPLTDSLALLYLLSGITTPVMYDPMVVAFVIDPQLCPVEPMHVVVDEKGITRSEPGAPNAQVCLHSDADTFFRFYLKRFAAK